MGLVCWMVRLDVTLRFVLSGFGSVCFVGILLIDLVRLSGFIVCWSMLLMGLLVMVLHIRLLRVLVEIGFVWSADEVGWVKETLPFLSNLASPIQHFWSGCSRFLLTSVQGRVSWWSMVGSLWYVAAPQL